jgi:hypothetical protein
VARDAYGQSRAVCAPASHERIADVYFIRCHVPESTRRGDEYVVLVRRGFLVVGSRLALRTEEFSRARATGVFHAADAEAEVGLNVEAGFVPCTGQRLTGAMMNPDVPALVGSVDRGSCHGPKGLFGLPRAGAGERGHEPEPGQARSHEPSSCHAETHPLVLPGAARHF